jgi:phage shock protein A
MLSETIAALEDGLDQLRRQVMVVAEAVVQLAEQVRELRVQVAAKGGTRS